MIKTIAPESIPTHTLHGYLLGAVAPRPIAFASTVDAAGQVNLSPFSFFNVFSANPPIMIFSPARRGTKNTTKHTFDNLLEVPETVVNIVNHTMVEQMSLTSTEYPKGINEFTKAGFTEVASVRVAPPRVGEAPVAFECKVDDIVQLGAEGGAGNLVICRVVLIHIDTAYLDEEQKLDARKLDLVARMGGDWYCRASGDALFEIPKPLRGIGIGVDRLPASVRNSSVLTGNNLGRLGNVKALPDATAIESMEQQPDVAALLSKLPADQGTRLEALHRLAQGMIEAGDTEDALKTLLLFEEEGA